MASSPEPQEKILIETIPSQDTWAFRQKVLLPHLSVEECRFSNDNMSGSFHLGAFVEGKLTGVASFYPEINENIAYSGKNPYRLRQMGTLPEMQKQGIARKLLDTAVSYLQMKNCELLWCHAREKAFPFYEKMGFTYQSDLFDVPNIGPHRLMTLDVPPMD
ncbi:MAG: GNAT family N-acetyltransferase [Bdellovibrionaceae bacterium]|nr:GNAT family N-acetyltransferase [Bdellovibrionales bacterium]MCB9083546.1 GNAT family N-acetyltransferase [Pseudobdellovibrionaceae bacterium]